MTDRQIAGPIESRRLHERAAQVDDAALHADLIHALDLALDARDWQIAGLVEALRPFADAATIKVRRQVDLKPGRGSEDYTPADDEILGRPFLWGHIRAAARALRSLETEG